MTLVFLRGEWVAEVVSTFGDGVGPVPTGRVTVNGRWEAALLSSADANAVSSTSVNETLRMEFMLFKPALITFLRGTVSKS